MMIVNDRGLCQKYSAMLSPAVSDLCRGRRPVACEGLHGVLTIPLHRVECVDDVGRMIERIPA